MFASFKLPSLRPRARSFSAPASDVIVPAGKPPKTPLLGSSKPKHSRKRNSELEPCPSIASLRPNSVALNSDQLVPGDRIYGVNGINTSRMRHDEVTQLLENVDGNALLEIQYSLPNYASQNSLCATTKLTEVTLERIDGSLGLTLRGGAVPDQPHLSRPLIITQIRPNGPAHLSGLLKIGDRLLKVDHHPLTNKTLLEAQQLLRDTTTMGFGLATLTIEYDVSIMESVKYASGPLLVEIDRTIEENFGLVLTNCCELSADDIIAAGYFIEAVVPASVADRCGALAAGDQIIAIDDLVLEEWNGSTNDAERLLRRATKLQILPYHTIKRASTRSFDGFSTINSRKSRNRTKRQSTYHSHEDTSYYGTSSRKMKVCHSESIAVTLGADPRLGYGLNVSLAENRDILVSRIVPDSPASRCGCLQVGDRIASANHRSNLTLQEVNLMLAQAHELSQLQLEMEFDVADTIVPSSGIFTVKLPKRNSLGITITASKVRPDEPFIISEIRKGSLAHRIGSLHAGDRLLAIDNRPLDHLSLESAFEILQASTNDIVTLKVEKTETENDNLFLDSIVYTVELHRYGGPLGITIAGSEECHEPIVLSRLTEGGLAEKTGALHVGDRILAINGEGLENRPLSAAIRLLQTSGDRVQLKIARNLKEPRSETSPGVLSVDSAIHSWDSNTNATENHLEGLKETESILSEAMSYQNMEYLGPEHKKHDSQLQFYSDGDEICCPSPLPLPNYSFSNANSSSAFINRLQGTCSNESIQEHEIYHLTLYKDSIYDDYGFSVSDGLYEKGVYINRIRKGGPADIVGLLKPFDRIIQVNDTKTKDFDCCLTVPLIASAGDRIELLVARNPYMSFSEKDLHDSSSKKSFSVSQNTITKTI